jgi:hypothetical protein
MNAFAFDTLAYVKRLRDAGVDAAQAEAQAEALTLAMQDSVATKADITQLGTRLDQVELSLNGKIEKLELTLRAEIKEVHSSVIKWVVPLLIGQTAVLAALMRLL